MAVRSARRSLTSMALVCALSVLLASCCCADNTPRSARSSSSTTDDLPTVETSDWSIDAGDSRGRLEVTVQRATLYQDNRTESLALASVSRGAKLHHFGRDASGEFYRTTDSGERCYVLVRDVEPAEVSEAPATAVTSSPRGNRKTASPSSVAKTGDADDANQFDESEELSPDDEIVLSGVSLPTLDEEPIPDLVGLTAASNSQQSSNRERSCRSRSSCCAVCRKGVACGDSCIASSRICNWSGGCACNSWEVCN